MDLKQLFFAPLILSAIIGFLATPIIIKLAKRFGIIDDPAKSTHPKIIHTYPTPRGGGAAIYIAILVSCLIFLPLDKYLFGILLGATVILVMGILDDKFNLNPYLRLVIQFIAAAIPVLSGIGISFLTNPLGGMIDLSHTSILSNLFAVFLLVFMMNILNLGAKGVDGQLSGVAVIAATTIAILSLRFSADITEWPVIIMASIVTGAFLGFLPWHIYPQKIMPSFSGSNLAGYFLGILAILSTAKVGTLLVVLAVPLIDTGYVILRRIATGHMPFWGDRGHLHHRLLDLGWSKNKVAIFYWLITALLGIMALNLNSSLKLYTMVGVSLTLGILILWLTFQRK